MMSRHELREELQTLTPSARSTLRRVLIQEEVHRTAIAVILGSYQDQSDYALEDLIDSLRMDPNACAYAINTLDEIEAQAEGASR
jgi:hypothetical protein